MIKKVAVIGPESTGKSTLCEQLAAHYGTSWVPEYARAYLQEHGTHYTFEDLLVIARGQVAAEDWQYLSMQATGASQPLLVIDTDLYVLKVWSEFVFDRCHTWILDEIARRSYDLYLLCDTDLPWIQDDLREYPDLERRRELYYIYKDIMVNQSIPWVNISGNYEQRLHRAVTAVDELLARQ
jgi:NadR type nicotinamide-nucleotide adenylyltransferase